MAEAVVVTSDNERGHGGWLPPSEREGLDWLTLLRLLGWRVDAARLADALESSAGLLLLALDPDRVDEEDVAALEDRLRKGGATAVCRAPAAGSPLGRLTGVSREEESVRDGQLEWLGPDPAAWTCSFAATRLAHDEHTTVLARFDGDPCAVTRRFGAGMVATLGFHPSAARDAAGAATALLRRLLVTSRPSAWLDLESTLVLRMDDPGGAQNVYCREWCYEPLGAASWQALGNDLRRRDGRLSVCYSAGFVDDGDARRGRLLLGGRVAPRTAGAVHASPLVLYEDLAGHAPGRRNDYRAEFDGIQRLRGAGLGDVELHGHTHVHPDRAGWLAASDRYESMSWFRELGRKGSEDAVRTGLAAIERWFETRPTTLVPPGDELSAATLAEAHEAGLVLVDSYYLAFRHREAFVWSQHVCAPYLDRPSASWFEAGLPVVGYFHDYEPAVHGTDWMTRWLDEWQAAGATRLIDFRELAGAVGRRVSLEPARGTLRLVVETVEGPPLVRPLPVQLTTSDGLDRSGFVDAVVDGVPSRLPLERVRPGIGRVHVNPTG